MKSGPRRESLAERPLLSIIIPMLDEGANVEPLFARLLPVLDRIDMASEIICVDDGSADDTVARLKAMRAHEPQIHIVSFSRNFGKEVALAAGLRYARGDAVVLMDGDLQHPPEAIEHFVARWREGFQMVYGQRRPQKARGLRRLLNGVFYWAFAVVAQTKLPQGACDFRLIDRRAVDALNALTERTRFTKGLYTWIGFKQAAVPFEVESRKNGRSGWSTLGLWRFAVDAITSFSMIPLRIWSYVGGVISLFAIGYGLYCLIRETVYGTDVPAISSLMIAVTFFAGVQLLSLGVIGEYLGRVFTEVKQRPLFLVAEEVGFADRTASNHSEALRMGDAVAGDGSEAAALVHPIHGSARGGNGTRERTEGHSQGMGVARRVY